MANPPAHPPFVAASDGAAAEPTEGALRPYDEAFMRQAIALAEHGRGRTSPNPLVGAVVVDESLAEPTVLATGYHVYANRDHAEVAALRRLAGRAPGKTLYVTLEPCNHVGRTGKCTEAILAAGLRRVVIGIRDPNARVAGHGIERLRAAGVEVAVGVLAGGCRHQNRAYLRWLESGRAHLVMKAALSLDGRLAPAAPRTPYWLTGAPARLEAHRLRDQVDAVLVGAGTVEIDDPLLTVRLPAGERRDERQPVRVVLDGALRTAATARLAGPGTLILTSEGALADQAERAAALRERGVELLALPSTSAGRHHLDLQRVAAALGERHLHHVLCEGGAALHGALLAAGLYDEAALFIAPIFLGDEGLPLARGLGPLPLADAPWLADVRSESLGADTLITGRLRGGGFTPREGL